MSEILPPLPQLTWKEAMVLTLRRAGMPYEVIGRKFQVTRERVRQIETKAWHKLDWLAYRSNREPQ